MTSPSDSPAVILGSIAIHQDTDGRYSLNDLHKAAGNENRHRPSLWLDNQQAQDLIAELSKPLNSAEAGNPALERNQPVKTIRGGNNPGTYVVRELVYAYAMWISARFHLQVIRTFDAVMTGNAALIEAIVPSEQQLIQEAVQARIADLPTEVQGKAKAEIWSRLHRKFRIAKYSQLPRTQVMEAILYITKLDLRDAPAPNPHADERISDEQHAKLLEAIERAMIGWVFTPGDHHHAHNALRVIFSLHQVRELPASDLARALEIVAQIKAMNNAFMAWVMEARKIFLQEYVMAGAPWTPWLKREWKRQMRAALPPRPNWLDIQRQLEDKLL